MATTPIADTPADTTEIDSVKAEVAALKNQIAQLTTPVPTSPGPSPSAILTGSGRIFKVVHNAIGSEGTYGPFYKDETVFESQLGPNVEFMLRKGAIEPLTQTLDGRYISEGGAPAPGSRLGEIEAKLAAVNEANAQTADGQKTSALQQAAVAAQLTAAATEKPIA